jgi:DNA polymerase III delta prime subunit
MDIEWQKTPSPGLRPPSPEMGEENNVFKSIAGHKRQLEFLSNAVTTDKLAHAYTFAGPDSVGKKMVALKLAQVLLESEEKFHPDLLEINGDGEIKIEQIRELVYKLSLKPYMGKFKVAIIDQAENLNTEAANALLKTLEEARPNTIIILVTANPNRLPKTIISRTQKINFGLVAGDEFAKSGGKPGLAHRIANDKDFLESLEINENYYKIFMAQDLPEKLIAAYEIAELETVEIKTMLETWMLNLQTLLQAQASKKLADKIGEVVAARRFLEQNVNPKLLMTNLMINTSN